MVSNQQRLEAAEGHVSGQANKPLSNTAHALTSQQVVQELSTDATRGLSSEEAARLLGEYGANDLGKEKGISPIRIFISQIANAMTFILILALAASLAIQAWIEGGVLAFLILMNVVIGTQQDIAAARTIANLNSLSSPTAQVIRDGNSSEVDAATLVPGDIIELRTGDSVPADARLLDCVNLEADEAALTGESVPVRKEPDSVFADGDVGPGDRLNVVYSSTVVTKGRGRAVVFATGMFTEIGAIAAALRAEGGAKRKVQRDENGKASAGAWAKYGLGFSWDYIGKFLGVTVGTPLQRKLSKLFLIIFGIAVVCAIIVLAANEFVSRNDVIIYAITIAVATLPVTLVLVLTIAMAAGAKVMVERNVLVRNMRSLEALGGVTNICSDKTGTLTQGKMVARMAWLPNYGTYTVNVGSEPYNPTEGEIEFSESEPKDLQQGEGNRKVTALEEGAKQSPLLAFLDVANMANLATVWRGEADEGGVEWKAQGEPTEIAIQVLAARFGRNSTVNPSFEKSRWNHLTEFPFDSAIKKMSVMCESSGSGQVSIFTKGAVERIIDSCTELAGVDGAIPMTKETKNQILSNMESLARRGFRVLAMANRATVMSLDQFKAITGDLNREEYERDLTFLGLVGIYDPPRPETRPSVLKCHQAGIGVHMLTGDHPETAKTIATEVGILPKRPELLRRDIADSIAMTAAEFDKLTDDEIDRLPELPLVVARCAPSTKVRMIDALHRRGRFVAMTGDGVNDSPSLHRADIGIAMGLNGSDVAKSASDIILSDDNFASILNAVEEGRRIFDNIQKFMLHVLALNVGFVIALLVGLVYKDGENISIFQVTPIEILFMLLVAGAFTETGLAFETASPDILNRPPQSLKAGVFTPEFIVDLLVYGALLAVSIVAAFIAVQFGFFNGGFGRECNLSYSDSCEQVFRARSTCFITMMWTFLFFAWELIDSRRSFFDGIFSNTKAWGNRLWKNKFLFWSVFGGFIICIPTLYIPVLNHDVFLHTGIDQEWGVVFAVTIFFVLAAEGYKWGKRTFLRRRNLMARRGEDLDEENLEARAFQKYYDSSENSSESEK
ncbi:hypothetical protein S40293_04142 [Stachybotrys chartarum IBT 40293]|nr:hypothetical protein S40293_04142 [Stachybotrys chartarum IBT 40293]